MVAFFDRLSRNFEDGVRIQTELTRRNIGIAAIRENIDTREGSVAAKFFRRSMLVQGAHRVDSAGAVPGPLPLELVGEGFLHICCARRSRTSCSVCPACSNRAFALPSLAVLTREQRDSLG